MGAREFVGGRAQVHFGVVQDEVFEGHERALQPQAGAGIHKMRPAHPPVPDGARPQALIKARERVVGGRERARKRVPGQRIGDRRKPLRDKGPKRVTEANCHKPSATDMVNEVLR